MNTWLNFVTGSWAGPVCLAVTIVLLVLSAVAWRKKGARSGIRGIAWSLLPLAAYLTHALGLVGRLVSAVVQFATAFAFSPKAWLGVVLIAISVVLFLVSGGIPLAKAGKKRREAKEGRGRGQAEREAYPPAPVPATRQQPPAQSGKDDDMGEVQDILRKHGIS